MRRGRFLERVDRGFHEERHEAELDAVLGLEGVAIFVPQFLDGRHVDFVERRQQGGVLLSAHEPRGDAAANEAHRDDFFEFVAGVRRCRHGARRPGGAVGCDGLGGLAVAGAWFWSSVLRFHVAENVIAAEAVAFGFDVRGLQAVFTQSATGGRRDWRFRPRVDRRAASARSGFAGSGLSVAGPVPCVLTTSTGSCSLRWRLQPRASLRFAASPFSR